MNVVSISAMISLNTYFAAPSFNAVTRSTVPHQATSEKMTVSSACDAIVERLLRNHSHFSPVNFRIW